MLAVPWPTQATGPCVIHRLSAGGSHCLGIDRRWSETWYNVTTSDEERRGAALGQCWCGKMEWRDRHSEIFIDRTWHHSMWWWDGIRWIHHLCAHLNHNSNLILEKMGGEARTRHRLVEGLQHPPVRLMCYVICTFWVRSPTVNCSTGAFLNDIYAKIVKACVRCPSEMHTHSATVLSWSEVNCTPQAVCSSFQIFHPHVHSLGWVKWSSLEWHLGEIIFKKTTRAYAVMWYKMWMVNLHSCQSTG